MNLRPSVMIAQPILATMPCETVISFSALCARTSAMGILANVAQCNMAPLSSARNRLISEMMGPDVTHLLFVDADMVVPADAVARLLARNVDIVSGLYFMRKPPFHPVAFKHRDAERYHPYLNYSSGISKVVGIGMGCCLIRANVFRKMKEHFGDEDYFSFEAGVGEDLWFGERAMKIGFDLWLDAEVKCGHVATVVIEEGHFKRHQIGDVLSV